MLYGQGLFHPMNVLETNNIQRTLEQTITTWETFKTYSLPKIQDGRISPESWNVSVSSIDQTVELLKPKMDRIKRGIQDVRDLREGVSLNLARPVFSF